ncbi:MAG TPA: AMP-binding protein [Thermoanaerobaculia bacterium]|nr:AMP-binding protein [Thermoanaerobaculia bacterium]
MDATGSAAPSPESLVGLFAESVRRNWTRPALLDWEGKGLTYGQVADEIARLHDVFRTCHVAPGDKIALLGRNSASWAVVWLATVTYGAVIVPILPDFRPDDVHHIVNHSDAVLFFVGDALFAPLDPGQLRDVGAVFSLTDTRTLHCRKESLAKSLDSLARSPRGRRYPDPERFQLPDVENDRLAAIVYTSGTTGFSKGVMLEHRSLLANVVFAQEHMPLEPGDTIVSFLPLAHAFGCAFEFLFPFASGCAITFLAQTPSPKVILDAFGAVRPRLILSVPLVIEKIYSKRIAPALEKETTKILMRIPPVRRILQRKIREKLVAVFGGRFREIVIGGAALNGDVERFFRAIDFPFTCGYGMTECGPLISYSGWKEHKLGGVGKKVDTLEVRVESADPQRVPGEILVRGVNVMAGYYKNPEATTATIDAEGWLHTGDLGVVDAGGTIFISGRSKTVILGPSGQNIYPEEIEARLNSLPFVGESLVIERKGKLFALVYPDLERVDHLRIGEQELVQRMEKNRIAVNRILPPYAAIARIDVYSEEFQKTPTKKIKRFLYSGGA